MLLKRKSVRISYGQKCWSARIHRVAHACILLVPELSLCSVDHIYSKQTVSNGGLRCSQKLQCSLVCSISQCVFVCFCTAEIRIHSRISLDHSFPSTWDVEYALFKRMDPLSRFRVPKHGQKPDLCIHIYLLQRILP